MSDRAARLRLNWKNADKFICAAHSQLPVSGLTHNLYKYPARFSPEFARSAIDVFSCPGELVVDPFLGGGTALVEARVAGRLGIGSDISSLAAFVSRTKTRILSSIDLKYLAAWFSSLPDKINLHRASSADDSANLSYTRNVNCPYTWTIRKCIELALAEVEKVKARNRQDFARCVILRTAQWALDGRKEMVSVERFRQQLAVLAESLIDGAGVYAKLAREADNLAAARRHRSVCLNGRAESLAHYISARDRESPALVVTSPPYPGVHVLYHRWQVFGGKETPAPFWIAGQLDGAGESYYLMHARSSDLSRYYRGIQDSFSGLARVASAKTMVVQLVAFSDPPTQLPRYLEVMRRSGFKEYVLSDYVDSHDGRLWRTIPSRRWHANQKGELASAKEVVLIHKSR